MQTLIRLVYTLEDDERYAKEKIFENEEEIMKWVSENTHPGRVVLVKKGNDNYIINMRYVKYIKVIKKKIL